MAVLITGGTGKTARHLERFLANANTPFVLTSRRGPSGAPEGLSDKTVKFDMLDESTFAAPFAYKFQNGEKITSLYLIAPECENPAFVADSFIDYVTKKGVKRIVMLAGSTAEISNEFVADTCKSLTDIGLEYCVLRPTWFNENFLQPDFVQQLKSDGKIYTACGDGKIPFISAKDIAAVAATLLTRKEKPEAIEYRLIGPRHHSYDDVANLLSDVLQRDIVHVKLTPEKLKERYLAAGLPADIAELLVDLETQTAQGSEEKLQGDEVKKLTGNLPQSLNDWISDNKAIWGES